MRPSLLILQTVARLATATLAVLSLYTYWVGHNRPGGGFVAGLLVSAGLAVQGLAFGARAAERLVPWPVQRLVAVGLLCAVGTGIGGWWFGYPFLTHTFGRVRIPWFGDLELATAGLFDLGVFLVVVGTGKAILTSLAREGRSQRPWNS